MTPPDMRGKVCLVTGASAGIGKATALGLAKLGATVLLVARDHVRGERAAGELRAQAPEGRVALLLADLAVLGDVRRLAAQVLAEHGRLDVLLNNAGVAPFQRRLTSEGLETTFATNHLGPFLLTNLLLDRLKERAPARIVNVASDTHRWVKAIPWDDLQGERRYNARAMYDLTKLLNVLFTRALAGRLAGTGVTANCLHPGWPIKTELDREATGAFALFSKVSKRFGISAMAGAGTSIFLASAPEVARTSGGYFSKCTPAESSKLSHDSAAAERLWHQSAQLCEL